MNDKEIKLLIEKYKNRLFDSEQNGNYKECELFNNFINDLKTLTNEDTIPYIQKFINHQKQ